MGEGGYDFKTRSESRGVAINQGVAINNDKLHVEIRPMRRGDIPVAMRLKNIAGWNQTVSDWKRFLALQPTGVFVATHHKCVVGTVTTCQFQRVGWIGMMLVEPAVRRRGVATQLMSHAIGWLEDRGCHSVWLDATPDGAKVYEHLGFLAVAELTRWQGWGRPALAYAAPTSVRAFRWSDWPAVSQLDRLAVGADRTKLLKRLVLEPSAAVWVASEQGRLQGFALRRGGSRAGMIGPLVARHDQAGRTLMCQVLAQSRRQPLYIDVPVANQVAQSILSGAGFVVQRPFFRMVRGRSVSALSPYLWVSSGPEKG